MDYKRKIDFAIKLLRNIPQDGPLELSYSGGKDSDVILELAKMAGIKFEAIYKNTTIDPPGTIAHVKENGVRIQQPKETFLKIIEKNSMPSRWSRFCCRYLKEYKIHDRAIQGIRRAESSARKKNYKEPEYCRTYSKGEKVRIYFPILEWTLEDVARFIEERGIKLAPRYYDENGLPHYERRLGCIGCPMSTDCGRGDYKEYPRLLIQIVKASQKYLDTHPKSKAYYRFQGDGCNLVFKRLFCKTSEEYESFITGGLFRDNAINAREYLENYFDIKL